MARSHVEVALGHPIKLIANALGSPPKDVIDQVHEAGVPVAALAGSAKHARRHVENGVDIVIAQGYEAGGHTGEIASMVLVPECGSVDALGRHCRTGCRRYRQRPSGGCGTCARRPGVWMGSAWLTASEYELGDACVRAFGYSAGPAGRDVGRHRTSRIYSGKPARLLKTHWTEAWDPARAGALADAAAEPTGQRRSSADERCIGSESWQCPSVRSWDG